MNRKEHLLNLIDSHPHYSRLASKLKRGQLELMLSFIEENSALNHSHFEMKLNRLFLDKEKPKNWSLICEFLMVANGVRL